MKKIAIIGAGFTGLSAAYRLSKEGIDVTVFEKEDKLGGLASGFKKRNWNWTLDNHYRHFFTSDKIARNFANEIGQEIKFTRPKTSNLYDNKICQLDSPISLLTLSHLPFLSRIRTGIVLAYLKLTPFWQSLEEITAEVFVKKYMGEQSWKVLWKTLFKMKFVRYSSQISASWFWTRINKRSASLGYPEGGFQAFAKQLAKVICQHGGKVYYQSEVKSIKKVSDKFEVKVGGKVHSFDKVVCTTATPVFSKITQGLSKEYKSKLSDLKIIGASNLVLSLSKPFFTDSTYWLNVNETKFPFVAVVEHTNFVNRKHYGNEHLLYVGNYLESSYKNSAKSADEIFNDYYPYLKKINKNFNKSWINSKHFFNDPYAQPIYSTNYSSVIPALKAPVVGLYLANMQMVYPWDRGVNYAIEFGEKVASLVLQSK
ncbi:FAD-dependent oxidoreductase [Patescibacteria group bacterium]|nr:FAD-dependent oxidoreductase [Patescibacteria group bacterium]